MGADGGTIPKRCELVRSKKKAEKVDKNMKNASKWRLCQLSQQPLDKHIIACRYGRLYNKESVIEGILNRTLKKTAVARHIKSMKDIKELKLTKNRAFKGEGVNNGDEYVDHNETPYVCPVTSIGMNGTNVFTVNWNCGCVVSEKAIQEVPTETCHGCGGTFDKEQLVVLNPDDELLKTYEVKLEAKRAAKKSSKVASKSSASITADREIAGPSAAGPSSSKPNNGVKVGHKRKADDKSKSIQNDASASGVYKSLFTSSEDAKKRPQAHWVTYNPLFN